MNLDSYRIASEPFYQPVADEIGVFEAAFAERLPVMLKGPTGCGKTRFVEHMAWRLAKPLVTVAAHEDMTASDLAGRYLLEPDGTVWHDGPLTMAVRHGAICYLDEIVEARQDTTVVIHPLTDARRVLPLEKHNEIVRGACRFPAHHLLQPRLSERGQGSEGIHQATLPRDRFRLSAAGHRGGDRRARGRNRCRPCQDPRRHRGAIAQSSRPRPRRRRLDPHADPRRTIGARGTPAGVGGPLKHRTADHR